MEINGTHGTTFKSGIIVVYFFNVMLEMDRTKKLLATFNGKDIFEDETFK